MFDKLFTALSGPAYQPPRASCRPGEILFYYGFTTGETPRDPGVASLCVEEDGLHAYGLLHSSSPSNRARTDNAETWLLGDVFELFFQIRGHEDYFEFHSTPEGFRLQLHIPDFRTFRGIPHREKVCECGLQVRNSMDPVHELWRSELMIPFEKIGLTPDLISGSRFTFARYQYPEKGGGAPEICSTNVFPKTAHMPSLWSEIL